MLFRLLLAVLAGLLLATPAQAHLLNMTRVDVSIGVDGSVSVAVRVDLTRELGGPEAYHELGQPDAIDRPARLRVLGDALSAAIQLEQNGQRVPLLVVVQQLPDRPLADFANPIDWPMADFALVGMLPDPQAPDAFVRLRLAGTFAFEEPLSVSLAMAEGGRSLSRWLVADQQSPAFALHPDAQAAADDAHDEALGSILLTYLRFGFKHILPLGIDHLLFVVGLYLGARSMRSLLVWVSVFTLAHSLTLILSSFGAVRVPAAIVEPLIAASIAWVAVENLRKQIDVRWRSVVVFAFGLLHGLGFAAALNDLGLPPAHFLLALLSFNGGVELGQISVIAACWLLNWRWRSTPGYRRWVVMPGSLAIAALATVWALQRLG